MKDRLIQISRCFFYGIWGFLSFIFIAINLSFWIIPVVVFALIKLAAPINAIKFLAYRIMIWIYGMAVKTDGVLLFKILKNKIELRNPQALSTNQNYLILSNHRSWADILILQSLLNKRTPPIQFIVKRELIFMPLIGLICWAYEYPFVRRKSLKSREIKAKKTMGDMNIIRTKIDKIAASGHSIINFVEGTRFHMLKSEKQNLRFKHLLNPHTGGLFYILKNYGEKLDAILDFTIVYGCKSPIFWKFLSGRCRRIIVDLQKIQIKDLFKSLDSDENRIHFTVVSKWLDDLWSEKDVKMEQILNEMCE